MKKTKKHIEKLYNNLLKDVLEKDYYKIDLTDRTNCYICDCGRIIKTKDIDAGVTPFMILCDRCNGMAKSSFYNKRFPNMLPCAIWYRPSLKECLELKENELDHVLNGGLLMRYY